jgi:predicted PurR-regulated permease PerM
MSLAQAPARAIVRIVLIIVAVAILLYLLYLLRRPVTWLLLAVLLATALAGPVNFLSRRMPRGLAITIVYLALLAIPVALGALVIPPLVTEINALAQDVPGYATEVREFVQGNGTLQSIEEKYDITTKLEQEAGELPARIDDAASILRDLGLRLVESVFALVTILVLAAFLLASGRGWVERALALQPADRAARLRRVLDRSASAVGGYVVGALTIAVIAGTLAYVVLLILGVPFRGPLAVLVGLFSLIPLIGATIAAVIVGVVTLFANFPTATIAWVIWAIVYQQVENHLIQPQIQKRSVHVAPFVVIVAVLFGSTLLGVLGALVAIPVAAMIQIALREWWEYRAMAARGDAPSGPVAEGVEPSAP